jgi:hypothetical protein
MIGSGVILLVTSFILASPVLSKARMDMAVVALAFGFESGITPIVHGRGIAKARPTIAK